MSGFTPRGALHPPLLDAETWDVPDHLTDDDCLIETGAEQRRTRGDLDLEHDND
ncbi:MAG TPA: hypothetical protein VGE54_06030 [Brevundimonas sp.]